MRPLPFLRAASIASLLWLAVFAPRAHGQAFLTWQGTGNNWNNSSRWNGWGTNATIPFGQLQWTGGGDPLGTNNIAGLSQWRLFFNGNTAYTLRGDVVRLFDNSGTEGGIMNRASAAQTIETEISFRDNGARHMFIVNRMGGSGTGGGGGALNLSNIVITNAVTTLNISGEAGTGAINVFGTIAGVDKSLTIGRDHTNGVQNGTLVNLYGNNSYSGGTIFRTGILRAGHNGALGTGKLTIDAEGASERVLASTDGNARTLANAIDAFNNLTIGQASGGTGSLNLAGSFFLGNEAGQNRTLTLNGNHTISGGVTGARGIVKQGAGTLTISGADNTSTGLIYIDNGGVRLAGSSLAATGIDVGSGGSSTQAPNEAVLVVGAAQAYGASVTVQNFGSAGNRRINFDHASGTGELSGNIALGKTIGVNVAEASAVGRFSGAVSGSGGITKSGLGRLDLTGNNSYTGATLVDAGELRINGNQSSATGDLTVGANAILSGSGTVGGATTINGTHNPGASPAVQSFTSDLTYNAGAVVNWELTANTTTGRGTNYDGIDLLGGASLNFAGATTLNLIFNQSSTVSWADSFWNANRGWLLYDLNDGVGRNFENLSINSLDWADSLDASFNLIRPQASFSLAQTGEDIFLVYTVPEPSTWALLVFGAGAMFLGLRRREMRLLFSRPSRHLK